MQIMELIDILLPKYMDCDAVASHKQEIELNRLSLLVHLNIGSNPDTIAIQGLVIDQILYDKVINKTDITKYDIRKLAKNDIIKSEQDFKSRIYKLYKGDDIIPNIVMIVKHYRDFDPYRFFLNIAAMMLIEIHEGNSEWVYIDMGMLSKAIKKIAIMLDNFLRSGVEDKEEAYEKVFRISKDILDVDILKKKVTVKQRRI